VETDFVGVTIDRANFLPAAANEQTPELLLLAIRLDSRIFIASPLKVCILIAADGRKNMERVRSVRTFVVVASALVGIVTSCSQPPTAPSPLSPSPPAPVPPSPSGSTLTGVVLEATEQGRRPIPGAQVFVVDLDQGPYGYAPWYELTTDINGRFILANDAISGRAVKLTAYEKPGVGPLFNQSDLFQVRAVHPTVGAGTTVEIELVRLGVQPGTSDSPVLSGVVFESTSEGRRPAKDMAVLYSSNNHDGADVYTRTDAEGRYRFWNLPVGAGYLLPACTRAKTLPPDFRAVTFPVDILGDTVLDAACP
jgi:hypothetical protein